MLDISQIITNEMRKREITFVSFSELVRTLHYLNKKPLQNSEIGDFLLLKLKPFNPYIYGNDADHLTFYYSPDLSDVTTDLDFVDDIDIVLKFAYSLCEGSFNSMEWENHFFNRELISRVLDITIPLNNKTQIEIYQNEPFTPEELKHTTIKPHQEPEIITAQIVELQARIMELEKENEQLKNSVLVKNAVDYDEYAIYGHSTPAIEAVFGTIKRFWVNADVTQPDTVANVDVIEEWIDENYSVSKTIKEAIQKITRPEKARSLGRKS